MVLAIITALVGLATLPWSEITANTALRREAERLAGILTLLDQQATLEQTRHGLLIADDGYQWLRYSEAGWEPPEGLPERLRSIRLPAQLRVSVEAFAPQSGAKIARPATVPDSAQPQVIGFGFGRYTPVILRFDHVSAAAQARVSIGSLENDDVVAVQ